MLILARDRERSANSSTRIAFDNLPRDYFFLIRASLEQHIRPRVRFYDDPSLFKMVVSNNGTRQNDGIERVCKKWNLAAN